MISRATLRRLRRLFSQFLRLFTQFRDRKAPKATLVSNIIPSSGAFARARKVGRAVLSAANQRATIIKERALDAEFSLSDANWHADTANDYLSAYRLLSSLDWNELKYLRLRAQSFSGYSLLHFTREPGAHSSDPIPNDFDERISDRPDVDIVRWRKLIAGVPSRFIFNPKPMLGEVGWWIGGVLLNEDTVAYQERMTLLHKSGQFGRLTERPRILEIGGGYGALATAILSAFPHCEYWICDLPESLLFSGLYLSLTRDEPVSVQMNEPKPKPGINLLPNYFFPSLNFPFDLIINTLSLSEMSVHQIEVYAAGISKLIGKSGAFFEQNQDNRHIGLNYSKPIVTRYFKSRATIDAQLPIHNGIADIWTNA